VQASRLVRGRTGALIGVVLLCGSNAGCLQVLEIDDKTLIFGHGSATARSTVAPPASTCRQGFISCPFLAQCAVDAMNDADNCGRCGHDCGGDECIDGYCPVDVLAPHTGSFTYGIAHDDAYVYWTVGTWEQGDLEPYNVAAVPKAGGPTARIFRSGNTGYWHPSGLVVEDGYVFFTTQFSGGIYRAILHGSEPVTGLTLIGEVSPAPATLISDGGTLFTARFQSAFNGGGVSAIQKYSGQPAQSVAGLQEWPLGLAVDDVELYWVTTEGGPKRGVWRTGKLNSAGIVQLVPIEQTSGVIALDETYVYFYDRGAGHILRMEKNGSDITPIADETDAVTSLVIDDTAVYWFAADSGRVMRVGKDGSGLHALAVDQVDWDGAGVMTVDETHAYWITDHQLRATPK
jgi:hypothetical protein